MDLQVFRCHPLAVVQFEAIFIFKGRISFARCVCSSDSIHLFTKVEARRENITFVVPAKRFM